MKAKYHDKGEQNIFLKLTALLPSYLIESIYNIASKHRPTDRQDGLHNHRPRTQALPLPSLLFFPTFPLLSSFPPLLAPFAQTNTDTHPSSFQMTAKSDPACIAKLKNKLIEASRVYSKDKETVRPAPPPSPSFPLHLPHPIQAVFYNRLIQHTPNSSPGVTTPALAHPPLPSHPHPSDQNHDTPPFPPKSLLLANQGPRHHLQS